MNTQPTEPGRKYPAVPKSRAYRPTGAEPGHDGEAPEFREAKDFVWNEGRRERVLGPQNVNCDRITYLFAHKRIEERQYEAARRLEKDWELSQISPVASTVLVGAAGAGSPQLPNDVKVDAMQRHGAAKAALGRNWAIIELVVHQHLSVEKAGARLRVNPQRAFGAFDAALHQLADHYRIA